jgi:hypothetical protein
MFFFEYFHYWYDYILIPLVLVSIVVLWWMLIGRK